VPRAGSGGTSSKPLTDCAVAEGAVAEGAVAEGAVPDRATTIVEPWLGRLATADGLFVTDEHQRIVAWSNAAQHMLGYSPDEVVGKPCFLVLMGREPEGHPVCRHACPVTKNARRGRGTPAYDVTVRTRDGSIRSMSNSVLVVDGRRGAFRVIHLLREQSPALGPGRGTAPDPLAATGRVDIVEALTRRELEALRMFSLAATIDEVAAAMSISIFTARNHLASAQRKLGARNHLEMVLIAMRSGLV
jgi:PAS domain S-box-containing protein